MSTPAENSGCRPDSHKPSSQKGKGESSKSKSRGRQTEQSDPALEAFELVLERVQARVPESDVIQSVRLSDAFQRIDHDAQERILKSVRFLCRLQSELGRGR